MRLTKWPVCWAIATKNRHSLTLSFYVNTFLLRLLLGLLSIRVDLALVRPAAVIGVPSLASPVGPTTTIVSVRFAPCPHPSLSSYCYTCRRCLLLLIPSSFYFLCLKPCCLIHFECFMLLFLSSSLHNDIKVIVIGNMTAAPSTVILLLESTTMRVTRISLSANISLNIYIYM